MSKTKIEWCDHVLNVITGCSPISDGCKHCFANSIATRFWGDRKFSDIQFRPERLDALMKMKKPRRIFLNSMGDMFHKDVPFDWLDKLFWTIACNAQWNNPRIREYHHTFMILTKRPERMAEYLSLDDGNRREWFDVLVKSGHIRDEPYLPNLWQGVTCENQATADERIPLLFKTPAAVRFLSLEPLLGEIDINKYVRKSNTRHMQASVEGMLRNKRFDCFDRDDGTHMDEREAEDNLWKLHSEGVKFISCSRECVGFSPETGCPGHTNPTVSWVIIGSETGAGYRPCKLEWIEDIVKQCKSAGVPVFVKSYQNEKGIVIKDFDQFPESIKFREFPNE